MDEFRQTLVDAVDAALHGDYQALLIARMLLSHVHARTFGANGSAAPMPAPPTS